MSETEASTFDVQKLRRGLRDLAALSALPVVWTESDPRRIAESLADTLLHMLHLEIVYILVRDRAYEIPIEVAHTARGPAPTAQAEEIGRALKPWLNSHDLSRIPSSIANPLGTGMTRIICPTFGIEARGGVLVACSPRADFPTDVDRLLLGVAANQVAILLDRRRTEDALRESEEWFRGMFENAGSGIADCDLQGRFLRVNKKLCEIVGYTREELLQKTWQDITHPDDLAASLEQFLPLLRGERPGYSLEKRYVRKDGSLVWIDLAVSLRRDAAGAPAYVIAILQDISERKRLEEEVLEISARERRRVGHDLHDGLGQYLAGIAVKAQILEDDLTAASSPHKAAAKKLVRLINNAVGQTRSLARGLDPVEVEISGLVPALQKLARETEDLFHVPCELRAAPPVLKVNKFIGLQLYRIAQEGVNNAVKHGQPARIEIGLATEPTHLRLRIRDDGRGFHSDAAGNTGMGLRIMQYRAHVIGGVLKIDSGLKQGTEIQCLVPMTPGRWSGVGVSSARNNL